MENKHVDLDVTLKPEQELEIVKQSLILQNLSKLEIIQAYRNLLKFHYSHVNITEQILKQDLGVSIKWQ